MGNFEVPTYGLPQLVRLTFQVLPEATKEPLVMLKEHI